MIADARPHRLEGRPAAPAVDCRLPGRRGHPRPLLVGSGIDAAIRRPGRRSSRSAWPTWCSACCTWRCSSRSAVQLVQGDRLVGTTAFWLTRPVSRGALLASKLRPGGRAAGRRPGRARRAVVLVACRLASLDALGAVRGGRRHPAGGGAAGHGARRGHRRPGRVRRGSHRHAVRHARAPGHAAVAEARRLEGQRPRGVADRPRRWSFAAVGSLAALAHQVFTRRTRTHGAPHRRGHRPRPVGGQPPRAAVRDRVAHAGTRLDRPGPGLRRADGGGTSPIARPAERRAALAADGPLRGERRDGECRAAAVRVPHDSHAGGRDGRASRHRSTDWAGRSAASDRGWSARTWSSTCSATCSCSTPSMSPRPYRSGRLRS